MKKALSLFMSLTMAFLIVTASVPVAFAAEYTGVCGNNVFWNLDTYTGELIISGKGDMKTFSADKLPSWSTYQNYIKSVTVENGVTSVGDYAFYNITGYRYSKMKTVTLSSSVESIGDYAFRGCKAITSVNGATGVKKIGAYAFLSCSGLTSFGFTSVSSVDNGAFSNCSGIKALSIPSTLTEIKSSAFKGCSSLTSLVIPSTVATLENQAFAECTGLTSVEFSASKITTETFGVFYGSGAEEGMDITFGSNITAVPPGLFENCPNIDCVTLGSSVTTVNQKAFYASGVRSVVVPKSVTSIHPTAFSLCNRLEGFTVDSSNTTYAVGASGELMSKNKVQLYRYPSGRGVTSYKVPVTVQVISTGAFHGDSTLVEVDTSNALTVYNFSFAVCSALESISMPKVKVVNSYSFADCDNLTFVSAPNVTTISGAGFFGCDSLSDLSGFSALTTIDQYAFGNCLGFESLTIPGQVTEIRAYAFNNCKNLTTLNLSEKVRSISDFAFAYCENLVAVNLNTGLETIGKYAFFDCVSLMSVKIPSTVTSIGDYAFGYKGNVSALSQISDFKIYCFNGSVGYNYAVSKNFNCEVVISGNQEDVIPPQGADMPEKVPSEQLGFIDAFILFIQNIFNLIKNIVQTNSPFGELV